MRVLVACEFSGRVRDAFIARGHEAMSCDYEMTWKRGPHYKGDVRDILYDDWDMLIAFPPCTHLSVSGARHFDTKQQEQREAIEFVELLLNSRICKIALENPSGYFPQLLVNLRR